MTAAWEFKLPRRRLPQRLVLRKLLGSTLGVEKGKSRKPNLNSTVWFSVWRELKRRFSTDLLILGTKQTSEKVTVCVRACLCVGASGCVRVCVCVCERERESVRERELFWCPTRFEYQMLHPKFFSPPFTLSCLSWFSYSYSVLRNLFNYCLVPGQQILLLALRLCLCFLVWLPFTFRSSFFYNISIVRKSGAPRYLNLGLLGKKGKKPLPAERLTYHRECFRAD